MNSSVRDAKLRARLRSSGDDLLRLRAFAAFLLDTIEAQAQYKTLPERGPTNYVVLSPYYTGCDWFSVVRGTKEYCSGYAEGRGDGSVVACGTFVVWPEARWGEEVEGTIDA